MSIPTENAAVIEEIDSGEETSYVDWPAIIAGVVLASAISLLLLSFGAAIGLSVNGLEPRDGSAWFWVAIAAAIWLIWVQVSSFMAGGYLTGRMRRRHPNASEHESDVRDGAHGLIVWAGALVLGGLIAAGGIGSVASTIGSAAGTATVAAATAADGTDSTGYFADMLLRSDQPVDNSIGRDEAGRILSRAGDGEIGADDQAYLGTLVARETGLSEAEASARVDSVITQFDAARAEAADAAETARKVGIIAAFLTAASLLVSAAGAYWAASMGGRHRDEGTVFEGFFRRY